MILYLIEKIKKHRRFLFYIGISFMIFGIIGVLLIENYDAFVFAGIGFILWVPNFFFLARKHKEEFGTCDVQLVSWWISSLSFGIFLIIVALFIL